MQDRATELLPPDAPGEDAGDGAYEHVRARVQALISAARDLSDTCADLADALRPLPGHEDLGGPDFGRLRAERTAALLDEAASAARGTLGLLHSAYSALERQLGRPPAGEVTAPAPRSGVSTWPDAFVELPPRTFTAEGEDDTAVACEVGPAVLEAEPGARVWESGERGEEDGPAPTGVEPAEQAASMGGSRPALAAVEPEARSEEADADGGQPPAGTLTAEDEPADADQGWTPAGPDEHTTEQPDDEADRGWTPAGPDEHTTEQPDDEADQGWTPAGPDEHTTEQPDDEADRGWTPAGPDEHTTEQPDDEADRGWTPAGPDEHTTEQPDDEADRGWTPAGPDEHTTEQPDDEADRGWTPAGPDEHTTEQPDDEADQGWTPAGPDEHTTEQPDDEADQGWTPAGPDEHTTEQPDDEADRGWTPAGPDEHTTEQPDDEADRGWTPAGPDEQPAAEADRGWAPADRTEPAEAGTEQGWTPTGPTERPDGWTPTGPAERPDGDADRGWTPTGPTERPDGADQGWTPTGPAERPEGDADRGWTPAEAAERLGEQVEDGEDRDRPPVGPAEATAEAERPEAGGGWRPGAAAAVEEPGWEPSRADEDERADRGAVTSAALAGWIAVDPDDEDAGGRPILGRKPDLPWRPDSDDHEPESPDDRLDDRLDDREPDDRESDDRGPADHQPAHHEPAAHEPADHEPADHEPADHEAAGQQPADYQPDFGLGPDLEDDRPTRAVAAQQAPAPVLTLPVDPHSGDGAGWHGDTVSPEPRSLSLVPPVSELEPDLPAAYPDPAPWRDEATPPMPATDPETWAAAASQATPYLTAGPTTTDPTAGPRSSWQPVPGLSSRPVWAAEVVPGASAAGDGMPVYPLDTVDVPAGDPDVPLGQDTPPTPAGPLDDPGAAVIARQVEAARRHLQAALVVANQPAAAPRLGALLTAVERVLTAVTDLARETRGVLESGLTDRTFPGEARFLCSPPWERTELVGRDSYGDDMASPAGLAKLLRSLGYEATSVTSAGGVAGVQVRSERYAVHVALVEPAGGGRQRWSGALEWTDATGASRTWAETLGPAELEDEELARRVDELLRRCVGATR